MDMFNWLGVNSEKVKFMVYGTQSLNEMFIK